mgnify:CR=1 FL=1
MRNEFAKIITELSVVKKDIVLLAGDIGNRLFDNFKKIILKDSITVVLPKQT